MKPFLFSVVTKEIDLHLLNMMENFADSPIILDMCDNIRLPAVDALYLKGRHHNINIICAGHTITDLNTKSRDRTPVVYITLISSKLFIEIV